jgi:DNA-binding NarL/FixJ family response regulator
MTIASSRRPDLAVMDIRLVHGDDGVNTAIAIFQNFSVRSVFVTAHSDGTTRSRADAARPLGWLEKPFRLDALVTAVLDALAARRTSARGSQFAPLGRGMPIAFVEQSSFDDTPQHCAAYIAKRLQCISQTTSLRAEADAI